MPHNRNIPFLDDTDSEDEMPPGWEERSTLDGDVYFVSHITKTTQWYHPLTGKRKRIAPELPFGWEMRREEDGLIQFVDVLNNRTTYTDPRLAFSEEVNDDSHRRPFKQRYDGHTSALEVLMGRDLRTKMYIVTGASVDGIGFETARSLALHGAHVTLACRDLKAGQKAASVILDERPSARVTTLRLDLACLASVREFAQQYLARNWELHGLVLNAGVFGCGHSLTVDGYETQFQVNHLGHFYLTQLLRERLIQTPSSRIVVVSSESHRMVSVNERNFDDATLSPSSSHGYVSLLQYGNTKLCNILFARHLALQLAPTGVRVFACHPGNMVRTRLARYGCLYRCLFALASPFTKTLQQAAATSVFCVAHKDAICCPSGTYFNNCCPCEVSPFAKRDDIAARLWALSERMVACAPSLQDSKDS